MRGACQYAWLQHHMHGGMRLSQHHGVFVHALRRPRPLPTASSSRRTHDCWLNLHVTFCPSRYAVHYAEEPRLFLLRLFPQLKAVHREGPGSGAEVPNGEVDGGVELHSPQRYPTGGLAKEWERCTGGSQGQGAPCWGWPDQLGGVQ